MWCNIIIAISIAYTIRIFIVFGLTQRLYDMFLYRCLERIEACTSEDEIEVERYIFDNLPFDYMIKKSRKQLLLFYQVLDTEKWLNEELKAYLND